MSAISAVRNGGRALPGVTALPGESGPGCLREAAAGLRPAPDSQHLRQDRDRGLGRGDRPDVETQRAGDARQVGLAVARVPASASRAPVLRPCGCPSAPM